MSWEVAGNWEACDDRCARLEFREPRVIRVEIYVSVEGEYKGAMYYVDDGPLPALFDFDEVVK